MSTVKLRIHGHPLPQLRARAFVPKGHTRPRMYDPETSRDWKRTVTFLASQADVRPAQLFVGPIRMTLIFYLPPPKTLPARVTHHTSKPDGDNLAKAVKDALRGVWYHDDSQIVDSSHLKVYATREQGPGVHITVTEIPGEGMHDRKRARASALPVGAQTPPPETSGRGRRGRAC